MRPAEEVDREQAIEEQPIEEYVPTEQPVGRLLVETPQIIGSVDTPGFAMGVFISGDHAFVADRWAGLQIIDISNLSSPVIIGSVDTPGHASGVFISGDHAFVADRGSGLQIIEVFE